MVLQKVTSVKPRVQSVYNLLILLDPRFRRNDEKLPFQIFYETIKIEIEKV